MTFQSIERTSSPGQVLAHLLELHPAPLEDGMVLPAQHVGDFAVRADLDLPDFLENLARIIRER